MVGTVIREQRKKQGMTLEDLAKLVGVTPGGLSQIERGLVDPSLSALKKIAKALNVSLYHMFTEESGSYVSRRGQRRKAVFSDMNIDYEFMTPRPYTASINPKVEAVLVNMKPLSWGNEALVSHEADECFMVVRGTIEVHMEEEVVVLEETDSIYLTEGTRHRLHNPTQQEALGLSVLSSVNY